MKLFILPDKEKSLCKNQNTLLFSLCSFNVISVDLAAIGWNLYGSVD